MWEVLGYVVSSHGVNLNQSSQKFIVLEVTLHSSRRYCTVVSVLG